MSWPRARRPNQPGRPKRCVLDEAREKGVPWRQWGPYLSERQWGTVREDYSENGDAWDYFTHDQARSRAYHWGEDGLAGLSDDKQRLCFSLALWNGKDPILKERIYGLTNSEANHGEDVKEYYFYLDSTPTHSYMKYLYKYPQEEFPYLDLIETNRRRSRKDPEYELLDTGIFNDDRYFDVFVEYAKASPTDILIQISICNRGPDEAMVHVLPTLWFRNIWTWWPDEPKPSLKAAPAEDGAPLLPRPMRRLATISCIAKEMPRCCLPKTIPTTSGSSAPPTPRLMSRMASTTMSLRAGMTRSTRARPGPKPPHTTSWPSAPGATAVIRLRLSNAAPDAGEPFGTRFEQIIEARRREADDVLSGHHTRRCRRRCSQCDAAGIGRDAVEQTILLFRRRHVAAGAWRRPAAVVIPPDAEPRVVPHDQRSYHLDARQMGISLVRRLGSGVSHDRALHRRRRFRQAAARPAAWRGFTCIRPDRSRLTSGTSATSIRRCMAGPRSFSTGWSRRCGARPTSIS